MAQNPVFHCTYRVTFTDRTRNPDGAYRTDFSFVDVTDADGDPSLAAVQQVSARVVAQFDGMVLGADLVDAWV